MIRTCHSSCTARADDNKNTHLFSLLSVNKFKSFLLNLRYKTHVMDWLTLHRLPLSYGCTWETSSWSWNDC